MRIPLFPLNVHLLPGGVIPLRLFEPRYLRMLGLSQAHGFGLCLLGTRREDGQMPLLTLGTRVEVIDFDQLEDDTLSVTVRGMERYRLHRIEMETDGLLFGEVTPLPNWQITELAPEQDVLVRKLGEIFAEHPDFAAYYPQPEWANACWVAQRWLEVLPLSGEQKLPLLESDDCSDALRFLMNVVHEPLRPH
ncbi:MAG: LON peptidase substrate-binding domain-containing protein [Aeromonadaceae bacterium]